MLTDSTFNVYTQLGEGEKSKFREWLTSHLKYGPVTITFTKKDGTERAMYCTLKEEELPTYEKKTERVKTVNEEVCSVFDIENQGWRSFRYDSIKEVRFDIE